MQPERRSDALLVPGAALHADGRPRDALRARLETALLVARHDLASWVIVSGGAVNSAFTEGQVMARWLVDHGLPQDRILVEDRARSTTENADRVVPLLRSQGVRRVTVISQPLHAERLAFNLRVAARRAGLRLAIHLHRAPLPLSQGALRWRLGESLKLLSDVACRIFPPLGRVLQGHPW